MSHRISDECVLCALCTTVCPESCILEDEFSFVIDADLCTDCGDCAPACPVACISGVAAPRARAV
jgi:Pyruvate/2-oxoacid:ferredoxin oxidoreductase delta subunit